MPQRNKEYHRKEVLARLRKIPQERKKQWSHRTAEELLSWPRLLAFKSLFGYQALPSEPDLSPFYEKWQKERKALAFPHVEGEGLVYRLGDESSAAVSGLGDGEPLLILVPALAYGPQGERLGRGGGYFDRFLAQLRKAPPQGGFFILGIAFPGFTKQDFPVDPWDQSVQAVLTAEGFEELPFPSVSGIFKS